MSGSRPGSLVVRRAPDLFIAIYLVVQIALPLSYYLGSKASDERFSWRMFSARRLASCNVAVEDEVAGGSRRVASISRDLQEAWVAWLRRGDPTVIEALARHRCGHDVVAIDYRRTCRSGAGEALPPEELRIPCP